MRILITGVPGWLGNRFIEILTSGFAGEGPPFKESRIRCAMFPNSDLDFLKSQSGEIEVVYSDVTEKSTLTDACKNVEVIFHIAGLIHPPFFNARRVFDVNTDGTRNLLSTAVSAGVKRFIFISSNSSIGCNPSSHALFTEDSPYNPYMNYGLSKYLAELEVKNFQEAGRIETVILRPCWYYGPCQPVRQTRFFNMIRKGNPIVFGNGRNVRSMSYVDNTCQAMILAATKSVAAGKTYWIADSRPYSMIEIYQTVAELLNVKLKPRFVPGLASDVCMYVDRILQSVGLYEMNIHVAGEMNKNIACSVRKAMDELGYQPKVDLYEGMKRSIEWCRKQGYLK